MAKEIEFADLQISAHYKASEFFSHQISKFWLIFEMVPDDDQPSIEGSSNCNIKSSHIFPLGSGYEMAQPTNKQLRWNETQFVVVKE